MKKFLLPSILAVIVIAGMYLVIRPKETGDKSTETLSSDQVPIQSHRSYTLETISNLGNIQPGQETKITYKIKNEKNETLKDFETVHEKIMHFIVVRKDLQEFQHLHPSFNSSTGEFSVNVIFPSAGPYRIFPDFTPSKMADNPMLLPVTVSQDLMVGDMNAYQSQPVVVDTERKKSVSGYDISYAWPKNIQSGTSTTYTLAVSRNNQPVKNLEPYLGAMGHSVILREDTLDFIHAHAESGKPGDSTISFTTTFPEAGNYRTFTQFQQEGKVTTSEYTLSVTPGEILEETPQADPRGNMMH